MSLAMPEKFLPLQAAASTYLNVMAAELDLRDVVLIVFEGVEGGIADIVVASHRGAVAALDGRDADMAKKISEAREEGCVTVALCAKDGTGIACSVEVEMVSVNAPGGEA